MKTDISPYLDKIMQKEGIQCIGKTIEDVYQGEKFRTIIETMSCFQ
jgi:hypothetical protein